jgi:DNA invertase Pin-like site-specific DNA recombinase
MALVFSYLRMSTKKQLDGDSYRRQFEGAEEWIKKGGHQLVETLEDIGLSAYHGKHKHRGRLGQFLEKIQEGRIPSGSIFLVENLDRLSREEISEAYQMFMGILSAGINIAVLKPQMTVYTKESVNDLVGLLLPLIYFYLAYTESANKADRLKKVWQQKRSQKGLIDGMYPAWCDLVKGTLILNAGAKAVKYIFERTAEGIGQNQLTGELNEKFSPLGRNAWNSSYVSSILNNRAVLGERQNYTFTKERVRVPIGEPIAGYYPRVIEDDLWLRVQGTKEKKKKMTGRTSDFINLFVGRIFNALDGHTLNLATNDKKERRFFSYGYVRKLAGSCPLSISYDDIEQAILKVLTEIKPIELKPNKNTSELRAKQQELAGIEKRLKELGEEIQDPNIGKLKQVISSVSLLEAKKIELEKIVNQMMIADKAENKLPEVHTLIEMLANANDQRDARMKLRNLIAETIERIDVRPEKHYGRIFAVVQVKLREGLVKQIFVGPGIASKTAKAIAPTCSELVKVDSKKPLLAGIAKLVINPPKVVALGVIPDDLEGASMVYLEQIRGQHRPENYRMIPSKIARFVDFLGGELPTRTIDGKRWNNFKKWLSNQKEITPLTAKINHGRAREFVRWLVGHDKCDDIDGLNVPFNVE